MKKNPRKETTSNTQDEFNLEIKENKDALKKALKDRAILNSRIFKLRSRINYLIIISPDQTKLKI